MNDQIPEAALPLLDDAQFATVATIEPSGQPQQSVVWVTRDGNDVLFSTAVGRRKHANLVRDPRCSILIYARDNPYSYLEVRGEATMTEEGGRDLIDALAKKYMGRDRYEMDDGTDNVRVVVRIRATKVVWRG